MFCILSALLDLLVLKRPRQVVGVAAAMAVFSLVHLGGLPRTAGGPQATFLAGGFIQGVGYYLASGCTLGLLLRLGEGSKFHLVTLVGFMLGMAAYLAVV